MNKNTYRFSNNFILKFINKLSKVYKQTFNVSHMNTANLFVNTLDAQKRLGF